MMATCKECLHYEACVPYADDQGAGNGWESRWVDGCENFKDRSLFVELPCKVGDTVYTNLAMRGWYYRDKYRPYSATVVFMGLNNSEEMGGGLINVLYGKNGNMMQFRFSDIGKTVFLTREEAEKALAERSAANG